MYIESIYIFICIGGLFTMLYIFLREQFNEWQRVALFWSPGILWLLSYFVPSLFGDPEGTPWMGFFTGVFLVPLQGLTGVRWLLTKLWGEPGK